MVVALREHVEQEQSGEISLTLIGLRYEGPNPSLAVGNALQNQGQWPGTTLLNRGVVYFGLVPDEGLGYLEARGDLEVIYAPEEIAQAMLEKNYLPPNVFGRGANRELQDRVFEKLGLEPAVDGGPIEEQLRVVAGLDEDDEEPEAISDDGQDRVSSLVENNTREELKEAARELRDGPDDVSLNAGKHDFAEFLVEFDEEVVYEALEAAREDEDEEENEEQDEMEADDEDGDA